MTGPQTRSKDYLRQLRRTAKKIGMSNEELYSELLARNKPELAQMLVKELKSEQES